MTWGPNNLGELSMSVGVKLPRSIVEASKEIPGLVKALPLYAQRVEQGARIAEAQADSWNVTFQALGVAAVFGGIIFALLLREKPKAS